MTTPALPSSLEAFIAEAPLHRRAIVREIAALAAVPPGTRVLDAGSGNAPYRPLFAHCAYTTHDWAASPHPGARSADVVADLTALPLDDDTFDVVLCTEVLEHVGEPQAALGEIARVLRPGGRLLLTVPFVMELHEEPHDYFRYTPHALRRLLTDSGFEAIEVRPLTGWYSTLSHVLRHCGLATRAAGGSRWRTRAAAFAMLVASDVLRRAAGRLDRLDERRAFPIGWVACARRVE